MSYVSWDPGNAGRLGNLQGQMTGYIAGLYSLPGMANISAAPTEVLNQNGYTVYQDTDTGHYNLVRDNHPNSSSIWTSQSLGVTLDCSGDKLTIKGMDEKDDGDAGDEKTDDGTVGSKFGLMTGTNFNYSGYTNEARNSFAQNSQTVLNRLNAAQTSNTAYQATLGLQKDESIDPVTGAVVDKEKSAAINELTTSEATKHKFDNIAKLINKVAEKQSKAEVKAQDQSTNGAIIGGTVAGLGAAALGAKIGAGIGTLGGPIGTVIGGVIGTGVGAAVGFFAGKGITESDEAKAKTANNEAAQEAKEAGEDLKLALEGLSDEELIAFQRYYYEQSGVKLTDVLKGLETDEDSSEIAQGAGFDSGYLTQMFENIDNANETIKPDEADADTDVEVTASSTTQISNSQAAQIEVLQQNIDLYRQYWQMAIQNGGSIELNGKTMSADKLSQMYINANLELDKYLDSIKPKE